MYSLRGIQNAEAGRSLQVPAAGRDEKSRVKYENVPAAPGNESEAKFSNFEACKKPLMLLQSKKRTVILSLFGCFSNAFTETMTSQKKDEIFIIVY